MSLTDIQQAFVHRYMDNDDDVIGVRVREIDGRIVLFVKVSGRKHVDLPETFRGLPIIVSEGHRAMLAYS
jgi:hypothetical protein